MRYQYFNGVKLYADLRRQCEDRECLMSQAAREMGVRQYVFSRLRSGKSLHVQTIIPLLLWLGNTDLAPYILQDADSEEEEEL